MKQDSDKYFLNKLFKEENDVSELILGFKSNSFL